MHDPHLMLAIAEGFGESPIPALLGPDVDAEAWLREPPEPPVVPPRVAVRLRADDLAARAAAVRAQATRLGLQVLTPADAHWPARLRDAPMRPLVLFARGDLAALSRAPAAAVVGSRTPTPYGDDAARSLGAGLARVGAVLWSGLARGVDRLTHEACLRAGSPTVAVLAGGLDRIYPPEHHELAHSIAANGGCLLAELPPGQRARRGHFVRRNRILAAGTPATIVVEASLTSGALHTARFAAECGADVFALPGPWRSERSQGCHRLITEGAHVIECEDALLQSLGLQAGVDGAAALRCAASAEEMRVLQALAAGPRPNDLLARECGLERTAFLRALFGLERRGEIERMAGDLWRVAKCGLDPRAALPQPTG